VTLIVVFEQSRYNPFISVHESVDRENKGSCFSNGLSARGKALAITVCAAVVLPFIIIGAALKLVEGIITLVCSAIIFKKKLTQDGLDSLKWAGRSLVAIIMTIVVAIFSILLPEVSMRKMALYRWDKYIYIPWCGSRKETRAFSLPNPNGVDAADEHEEDIQKIHGFHVIRKGQNILLKNVPQPHLLVSKAVEIQIKKDLGVMVEAYNADKQPYNVYLEQT